jgi:acetoin utilization deacetylase AcuC-like enzyme
VYHRLDKLTQEGGMVRESGSRLKIFFSKDHQYHNPPYEVFDGGERVPYLEDPGRMEKILRSLKETEWAEITESLDFGLNPILAVHEPDYLNFLADAWVEWLAQRNVRDTNSEQLVMLPSTFAIRRFPHKPNALLGKAGYYMMDLSACIVSGTFKAALSSAHSALSGAKWIADASRNSSISTNIPIAAFALCRPPGHHAGKDYAAGYCFINNAAVAANSLSTEGKVALLDIDYHAGNGTQDIFYERSDVLTISLHADPLYEYPYFAGYKDEIGEGEGLNFHRNFPLPFGTGDSTYLATLDQALEIIHDYSPKYLVVSVGTDIYIDDLLGKFKITRNGFQKIGKQIAALRLPTLLILEGGYNNQAIGENIVSLITGILNNK